MAKSGKWFFLTICLLCCALFVSGAFGEAEEENLLSNGDLEILDADGIPKGWFTDAYQMDPGYTVYSVTEGMDGEGSHAFRIHNTAANDSRLAQTVKVEPETMYCLSGYIRAEQITGGHGANLSIEGIYAFSEKVYDTKGDWKYIEYYGETGPDQRSVTVFARVGGYSGESKGTASFDRLSLVRTDKLPEDEYADLWYVNQTYAAADPADDDLYDDGDSTPGPAWPYLTAIILLYTALVIGVLYFFRKDPEPAELRKNQKIPATRYAPFLLLALGLRIVLSYLIEGYAVDVGCFVSWGYTMAHNGPTQFYQATNFCDYPPLYTYVLGINSWLSSLLQTNTGWTRVIFRLIPSLCDIAACWLLLKTPRNRFTASSGYRAIIILLAFNPVNILNSAAWGQMDSVLCLLLLGVAMEAVEGKWIQAIILYVLAVLVKPQALMLGFLGLAYMILAAVRSKNDRKKILTGTGIGAALLILLVLPFGIQQQPGWLIGQYANTLSSYPYATVNTANLYYLAGGNWSKIESAAQIAAPLILACACALHGAVWFLRNREKKLSLIEPILGGCFACWFIVCAFIHASWALVGIGAMAYAFGIVLSMAIRSGEIRLLPYLGALLFILLYVFGVKMHERYLFPALFLLMFAWPLQKDRRILYILLFFSATVFLNEGIVLDNSIRLGSAMGHLNTDTVWLADILSMMNVAGAIWAVYVGYGLMKDKHPEEMQAIPTVLPVQTVPKRRSVADYHPDRRLHWTKRDTAILAVITMLYSVLTLTTLGSTKAPQTAWKSSGEEEQIVFDLGEYRNDVRVLYFAQVSRNDFTFAQSDDGILWSEETYAQMDQQQCWKWKYVTLSFDTGRVERNYYNSLEYIHRFSGRYLRLTSQQVGLVLNEILFIDPDGNHISATIHSRTGDNDDSPLWSDPANLLDEQDTMENLPGFLGQAQEGETQPSWWNSTYFDEIYHARTGFEFTQGTVPYETTHPPLGKVFISWCISIFGMTPFGWRFAGAVAGILMLPGIYLLTKQLTKKTGIAAFACLLMALDCMHLTQTQIATIDSFPVLFIIYAFFFMLRFFQTNLAKCSRREALIPLALSGLNMGLSIASKWIGIYAGIGLAVLYFWHCFRSVRISRETNPGNREAFRKVLVLCLWCVLFFVIIPAAIYLLSYLPYMAYNTRIKGVGDYLDAVWRAQESMLSYHSTPGLGMDHPFYSPWWEWPIIGKPMYYATEQYTPAGASLQYSIFCIGNPAVWFGALGALVISVILWLREKHYQIDGEAGRWHLTSLSFSGKYEFAFIGLLAQYLPWVLVPRGTYIYHYFASIPFLILLTALCLDALHEKWKKAAIIAGSVYAAAAAVFFVLLLPYACGMAVTTGWLDIGKQLLRIWY